MDDFLQLVASRQSDRAYDMTRAVEPENIGDLLLDTDDADDADFLIFPSASSASKK